MKLLATVLLSCIILCGYSQSNEAIIKDQHGNVVGRVNSYTGYTGQTESILYDQNGHILGSVQGANCGPLLGTYFDGDYTIVSGSDVSAVILGNSLQPLDYYLTLRSDFIGPENEEIGRRNMALLEYYDSNPEYLGLLIHHIEIIETVIADMSDQGEINMRKYLLIEHYLLAEGAKKRFVKKHMPGVALILGVEVD